MQNKINISEHEHQVTVIEWCALMAKRKFPMLKWIYAVPNGGDRHKAVAAKLKAEGVKPGVPALCLPFPAHKGVVDTMIRQNLKTLFYHGLYIEMKSKEAKGRVSPEQKKWLEYLECVGYKVNVAWSANEAIQIIEAYLHGEPSTNP